MSGINRLCGKDAVLLRTAVIINPTAGRGRTAKLWPKLERQLSQLKVAYRPFFTSGPGEGETLARELPAQGYDCLAVCGGDGTLNEVINGLQFERACLAVIPTGTGNDFCRSAGIPGDPFQAVGLLIKGRVKKVDLGRANGRYFANIIGTGFDAEVARATNEDFTWLQGTPAYVASLFKVLVSYRNVEMTVRTEKMALQGKMLAAAVGNGQYLGAGMRLVPPARIDDGVFHLCLVGDVTKREILTTLPKIFSGGHADHPKVSILTAAKVQISTARPLVVQADGEIIGRTPIAVEIEPSCLNVLVPNQGSA